MSKFKFPRNPGVDRPNPFEDETGKNPFGDEVEPPAVAATTDDPFSPSTVAPVQPYQPEHYETTYPHRGRRIIALGILAVVAETLALIATPMCIWWLGDTLHGMIYCMPGHLVGLAAGMPGWIMSRHDLRAMRGGAMDDSGLRSTRIGGSMGWAVTLLSAVFVLSYPAMLILTAF